MFYRLYTKGRIQNFYYSLLHEEINFLLTKANIE